MKWDMDDSCLSEHLNTLRLFDAMFKNEKWENSNLNFYILGGAALVFHGLTARATMDIDVANSLAEDVKEVVEPFISDASTEVSLLPMYFERRLVPFHEDEFKHITVSVLSIEDLAVTKLWAWRQKDKDDLTRNSLLEKCDILLLREIINTEIAEEYRELLTERLESLY